MIIESNPLDNWWVQPYNDRGFVGTILMHGMEEVAYLTCRQSDNLAVDLLKKSQRSVDKREMEFKAKWQSIQSKSAADRDTTEA